MALIEIDGLPIKNGWIFPWRTVSHGQMVTASLGSGGSSETLGHCEGKPERGRCERPIAVESLDRKDRNMAPWYLNIGGLTSLWQAQWDNYEVLKRPFFIIFPGNYHPVNYFLGYRI